MEKINCYSRYTYNLFLVLSAMFLLIAVFPFVLFSNETLSMKIIWLISMMILSIIMFYSYLYHKQTLVCFKEKLILSNPFGVIQTLEPKNSTIEIVKLPTEFSWVGVSKKKWICIYDKNSISNKFKTGVSNSKKYLRIQILHNDENEKIIKKYFE